MGNSEPDGHAEIVEAWARQYPDDELILLVPDRHMNQTPPSFSAGIVGSKLYPHAFVNFFDLARFAERWAPTSLSSKLHPHVRKIDYLSSRSDV